MTYHKVLQTQFLDEKHVLTSALAIGKARQIYEPGVWTKAPRWLTAREYYLTAFDTYDHANEFLEFVKHNYRFYEIWECEAKDEIPKQDFPRRMRAMGYLRHWNVFDKIYRIDVKKYGNSGLMTWNWPMGTIMAKEIRLTRRIL